LSNCKKHDGIVHKKWIVHLRNEIEQQRWDAIFCNGEKIIPHCTKETIESPGQISEMAKDVAINRQKE